MIPRVIGIDPSLTATGVAWDHELRTSYGEGDQRLAIIHDLVRTAAGAATLAVVEDTPRNAKGSYYLGQAQAAVRLALYALRVPYVLVPPASLKSYATGNGNANKDRMRDAFRSWTGLRGADHNQVDAWWLMAMGYDHFGYPLAEVPDKQRKAMDKVSWPVSG